MFKILKFLNILDFEMSVHYNQNKYLEGVFQCG